MRGQTLSTIRTLLKAKLREAQETNDAMDAEFNYALSIKQQDFANAYDWEFMADKWDKSVSAGTRYLSFPTSNIRGITSTINFERPVQVNTFRSNSFIPVCYGIGICEMNARNSDNSLTQDPIQRWSMDTNIGDSSNPDELEVWPVPATAQTIRFTGQRKLRTFAADSDKADLDDLLLILTIAAEYLAYRNHKNASLVLKEANDHLVRLRSSTPTVDDPIVFGRNYQMRQNQNVKLIAIA